MLNCFRLLVLVPLLAVAGDAAAQAVETERVDRTLPLGADGTLRLKNFSGRVSITASDRAEVVIAALRRGTRERLDSIRLDIQQSGNVITVDANQRLSGRSSNRRDEEDVVNTEFDIEVPVTTRLDIDAFSSDVTTQGISADQRIKTFSGRIQIRDAGGDIEADTFSGEIIADASRARAANLTLGTFSADIEARVPDAAGRVRFDTFSGRLTSDLPLTYRTSSRRQLEADLTGPGGNAEVTLKTFSGDVQLRR